MTRKHRINVVVTLEFDHPGTPGNWMSDCLDAEVKARMYVSTALAFEEKRVIGPAPRFTIAGSNTVSVRKTP